MPRSGRRSNSRTDFAIIEPRSPRRFTLDQGFPKPPFAVHALDQSVEYAHFSDVAPDLAAKSTPDWLAALVAAQHSFDGWVTRDQACLDNPETIVALTYVPDLSTVTWRKGIDDSVAEWGQLLAYMPLVLRQVASRGGSIFLLPKPSIDTRTGVERATGRAHRVALRFDESYTAFRSASAQLMRDELARRGMTDLARMLA